MAVGESIFDRYTYSFCINKSTLFIGRTRIALGHGYRATVAAPKTARVHSRMFPLWTLLYSPKCVVDKRGLLLGHFAHTQFSSFHLFAISAAHLVHNGQKGFTIWDTGRSVMCHQIIVIIGGMIRAEETSVREVDQSTFSRLAFFQILVNWI